MGEGGLVEHALEELTGQPTRMLFTAEAQPESLWTLLQRATAEGWPAHGTAAVELPNPKGRKPTRLAVGHAGSIFDEIHLLDRRPYEASQRALSPLALHRLPAARVRNWVERCPEIEKRFRRRFGLQLAMLRWGKHQVTTLTAETLLRSGRLRHFNAGQTIIARGDAADGVYLVVEGKVHVHLPGKSGRASLGPAQVFGELEVLKRIPRLARAQAARRSRLVHLDLGAAAEVMEKFDILERQLNAIADLRESIRLGERRQR